jgi:leucyl aminopeptidase
MNFQLKSMDFASASTDKCDALVVLFVAAFEGGGSELSSLIASAVKSGDIGLKPGNSLQLFKAPSVKAKRLVLTCAGDGSPKQVRQGVIAALASLASSKNVTTVTLHFAFEVGADAVYAGLTGAAESTYVYTATKSQPADGRHVKQITLGVSSESMTKVGAGFERAVAVVKGIELAKEWGNRPANHATPTMLAEAAEQLGKLPKVKCKVLGPKQVAKLGMGSFMSVAQGSHEELRFIELIYQGGAPSQAPVVLIGKGITFDTGGISIKPAAEMDEMKFDMCGAASVLGTFRALAELKPAINVVGLIPTCENMPSGRAIKPGDVVTSMSGQTIEILNTDAEGRLILCDALTYAERFKPKTVIDIATLTGACIVALGAVRSGMFATSDELALALYTAGESSLDLCWRMPLDEEYAEGLKTNFADVANVAGRAGGAVVAAKFLQRFASKFAWGHLDVAGTAHKGGSNKGATGRPVGLLVSFLLDYATAK